MKKYRFDPAEKATLEALKIPMAVYQFLDNRVVTVLVSDGFCELFGFESKTDAVYWMDHDMYCDTHPDDKARIANEALRFATEGGQYEVIYRSLTHRGGEDYRIIHALGSHVFTANNTRLAYVWYTDEGEYTTEENDRGTAVSTALTTVLHEESIKNAGRYDYLTGLPSMSYFFDLAHAWRQSAIEEGETMALLYMDLSGMKYFNRKFGFAQGDKLLCDFSDLLRKHFSNENCSRFGSDHFCVFTKAAGIEQKLREIFDEHEEGDENAALPIRVGIYLDNDGLLDISTECDRAKYACDTMRNSYISGFSYFDETMLKTTEDRRYIIDNLDRAIREKWIQVYYQPIVRAANGRVSDEEALARWIDPYKGMLNPAEFIPVLEEAKLIYKLDLYITEQVLEKLKQQQKAGLYLASESVNLSRSDFDTCDIVEEIRKRVDEAGIPREYLTIEITESILSDDFEYMKAQIERFQSLGFRVWMDDFGSKYSSLDVLQSIHFDLIKFDMHFMKEFETNEKSRIILAELIKLAIALGVDTICEGVETKAQADFLREVGCTKLQGYYFCRPIPFEQVLMRYQAGIQIGFENPEESDYYAAIGRINLYDLAIVSNEDQDSFENYFNTLPMAVIETTDDEFTLIRCNNSYRNFMQRAFGEVPIAKSQRYDETPDGFGSGFLQYLRDCGRDGNKLLLNEKLQNGSTVHSFIKRVAVNPVTGRRAVAVVVLAILDADSTPVTFTYIARALSSDYVDLFYVDLKTDHFIQYSSQVFNEGMSVERHGEDFFTAAIKDAKHILCPESHNTFFNMFSKENIINAIDEHGSFTLSYRQFIDGEPTYVSMKAVRVSQDSDKIIIGVNNVDAQMREHKALEQLKEEQITYARISALSGDFICIYTVDPETDSYREYSTISTYEALGLPKEGEDFFGRSLVESERTFFKDDLEMFRRVWSKEHILEQIEKDGTFSLQYHLMINGVPTRVLLKAAMVEEKEGKRLLIGVTNVDSHARRTSDTSEKPESEAAPK